MASDKKVGSVMHLGAGALSGVASCVLLQPFDLLKTRIQQNNAQFVTTPMKSPVIKTIRSIIATDGVLGLWRGTVPSLIRNAPGTSLYFYFLNHTRHMCLALEHRISGDLSRTKLSSVSNMAVGASSRAMAGFLLMPGTLLKVHYESNLYKYAGIMGAVKEIWRNGGARGFFVGAVPTAIRDAPYAGLYMLMYEAIKAKEREYALKRSVDLAETTVTMVAGVLAGLSASYLTQPFDLVKTRMQLRPAEYPTVLHSFAKILREESFVGFFRGISLRVLRKGIQASLVFTLYEWVVRANTHGQDTTGPSTKLKA
ncbi:hypothetical protein IW140_000100 [Coemansia sp. RSA 1813]|nr:hypothetical protein EV178_000097 [Coemansia sp. RSA 1646]KAJ1771487.1 hypothetical protein LPJ74_002307 [Coemansia sp. RSA 1843]KAJ2093204.1 hypothetical protein IW138_000497 [Coemansia sp. RSA 986]KAJ2217531.1 hypothetical protein EV179_000365 [Coemansia sp. RSA 487]KAJ2573458.1 hypothetical protein IW140_000100 [Coemansia sp. RSA 1813]